MRYKYRFLITFMMVTLSLLFIASFQLTQDTKPTSTPYPTVSPETFDPIYYGLPEVIAGYKILAVQTSENIACMIPGIIRLILQTPEPDLESFFNNASSGDLQSEIMKLNINAVQWEFDYVEAGISKEQIISAASRANPHNRSLCELPGGPVPTFTPLSEQH